MLCSECGNELMIDHIDNSKVVYVCLNAQCTAYRKAFYEDSGKETNTNIKENTAE